jgi:hypothetical protein
MVIVHNSLANVQSGLADQVLEFLPAAAGWDLCFLVRYCLGKFHEGGTIGDSPPGETARILLRNLEVGSLGLAHEGGTLLLVVSQMSS